MSAAEAILPSSFHKQIPKKLLINEDDDEATKARKKKLLKQFKGKQRAVRCHRVLNSTPHSVAAVHVCLAAADASITDPCALVLGEMRAADSTLRACRAHYVLVEYYASVLCNTFALFSSAQAELEAEAQQRAQSWQNFKKGKGAKKQARGPHAKPLGSQIDRPTAVSVALLMLSLCSGLLQAGCFTNMKKESMFKVPDELGGKVGVIGSGKGARTHHNRTIELTNEQQTTSGACTPGLKPAAAGAFSLCGAGCA